MTEIDNCSICLSTINNKVICKQCNNTGCYTCIETWLISKKTCPICRSIKTYNITINPDKYIQELLTILNLGLRYMTDINKLDIISEKIYFLIKKSNNYDYLHKIFLVCCNIMDIGPETKYIVFINGIIYKCFSSNNANARQALAFAINDNASDFLYNNLSKMIILKHIIPAIIASQNTNAIKILFNSGFKIPESMRAPLYTTTIQNNFKILFKFMLEHVEMPLEILDVIFSVAVDTAFKSVTNGMVLDESYYEYFTDIIEADILDQKGCDFAIQCVIENVIPDKFIRSLLDYIKKKNFIIRTDVNDIIINTFKRQKKKFNFDDIIINKLNNNLLKLVKEYQ